MSERLIETPEQRTDAINAIAALELPYRIQISPKKLRSNAQNARYWDGLQWHIDEVNAAIGRISDHTGHTPLEIRKLIATGMSPEHTIMLFSLKKEAIHDTLKLICDVPTSTRLGTKKFMEFEGVMEQQMAEVLGEVKGFLRI